MEQNPPLPDPDRRRFLGTLTGALAAGLVVQILGCTDAEYAAGPAAPPGPGCPDPTALARLGKGAATAARTGTVGANHPQPHTALVSAAVLDAGSAYMLNIQGSSDHNHTVSLTALEIHNLKSGLQLSKTSSTNGGHNHSVTFALVNSATPSRTGNVGDNHGHTAVVTGVVQDAGSAHQLHIAGGAGHDHVVPLTAQEVADLKAGIMVSKESVNDETGHTHMVTFAGTTAILQPAC